MIPEKKDNSCNICGGNISRISSINSIDSDKKHSWESDSTFKILNFSKIDCFLGFCNKCFQSTIYPKFNTDLIYTDEGAAIRKKYYERYNVGETYGESKKFKKNKIFQLVLNELNRFRAVSQAINKACSAEESFEYSILDYGGGDGYISGLFSLLIKSITNSKVKVKIYDLMELRDVNSNDPLGENKFDLVILSHVIEHTHNPKKILEKLNKCLKQQGIIYCEIPDERLNLVKIFYQNFGLHYHVTHHTRRSLYSLFSESNFNNIKTRYFYNSSNRGHEARAIIAIAGKGQKSILNIKPLRIYELFSFVYCIFKYSHYKLRQLLK